MLKNLSIPGCFFFSSRFLTHRYEMYVASAVLYWARVSNTSQVL